VGLVIPDVRITNIFGQSHHGESGSYNALMDFSLNLQQPTTNHYLDHPIDVKLEPQPSSVNTNSL